MSFSAKLSNSSSLIKRIKTDENRKVTLDLSQHFVLVIPSKDSKKECAYFLSLHQISQNLLEECFNDAQSSIELKNGTLLFLNQNESEIFKLFKSLDLEQFFTFKKISATLSHSTVELIIENKKIFPQNVAKKIKVLIVDDSNTVRMLLQKILSSDSRFEVVGAIGHPPDVMEAVERLKPDVITMDIHMPHIDGITLVRKITPKFSTPIVMISSISKEESELVLSCLEAGAIDYIEKPALENLPMVTDDILNRISSAAQSKVQSAKKHSSSVLSSIKMDPRKLIVIGSSTGGTEALRVVLEALPANIPPILIVQHIPAVFSKSLADRLDKTCKFRVFEATEGQEVVPNQVLIAPGGKQMGLLKRDKKLFVRIKDDPPMSGHKPSVNYLFKQVATLEHPQVIGVILTGMGADGASGLLELRKQGARTIGQDEKSCVVYGMPRVAFEMGAVEKVLDLSDVASALVQLAAQAAKD